MTGLHVPNGIQSRKFNGQGLPLLLEANTQEFSLVEWAREHRTWIEDVIVESGAILFRNFRSTNPTQDFENFSRIISEELLEYVYRSTPRTTLGMNIYTATEYPPKATIPQHNENAYCRDWPMKIAFLCAQKAPQGGETPLSRTASVTRRISDKTRDRFRKLGVLYVRNYHDRLDLPWETVFQTDNKEALERFCQQNNINYEWRRNGVLRTSQVCQAMAVHPKTCEELWFNQAHLFHVTSLDSPTRKAMLSIFNEDELPRNTYYGDGSPIEPAALDEIRAAFSAETVTFPWQSNDVLLIDNMLVGHGRNPFSGPRRVLVSMGQPFSCFQNGQVYPSANCGANAHVESLSAG